MDTRNPLIKNGASKERSNGRAAPDVGAAALLAMEHEIAQQQARLVDSVLRNAPLADRLELLRVILRMKKIAPPRSKRCARSRSSPWRPSRCWPAFP